MSASNIHEAPASRKVAPGEDFDALSVYQRELETRKRMSRDEERRLADEMATCREDIVTTLGNLILEAGDAVGLDPATVERLRAELAQPANGKKIESLQARIEGIVSRARQATEILRKGKRAHSSDAVRHSRHLLEEIARGFGVSPATLERIATDLAQKRKRIAIAKQRLVEANLRLVLYFARKMKWRGVDTVDLVQEGNLALLRAADTYDPRRGFPFATFACTAIRRAMSRFGSAASRPVHVPVEVRARRTRIRKVETYLTERDGVRPSWETLAEYLEVPIADVIDALGSHEEPLSLDASGDDDAPIMDRLVDATTPDVTELLAVSQADRQVRDYVATLDARDRRVIEARFALQEPGAATLADIGRDLGVTRERARQLEARALRQLRTHGRVAKPRRSRGARTRGRGVTRVS